MRRFVYVMTIAAAFSGCSKEVLTDGNKAQFTAVSKGLDSKGMDSADATAAVAPSDLATKSDLDVLNKLLEEETASRIRADEDERLARIAADERLEKIVADLETRLNDKIKSVETALADLDSRTASRFATVDAMFADLRAELDRQRTEFQAQLDELKAKQSNLEDLILFVQNEAKQRALDLENKFTKDIKDLADKTEASVNDLQTKIAAANADIADANKRIAGMDERLNNVEGQLAELGAQVSKLEKAVDAAQKDIEILKFFKDRVQFCAAATVNVADFEKRLIKLTSANAVNFGASTTSQYGFGQMFDRHYRYKLAEVMFDHYHYNAFLLEQAKVQSKLLTQACAALIAYPDKALPGGNPPIMGQTTLNGSTIKWNIPTEAEIRRDFRLVMGADEELMKPELERIVGVYNNILVSGNLLTDAEWGRHVEMILKFVASGTKITGALISRLEKDFINSTVHKSIVMSEGNVASNFSDLSLCRFGKGSAAFSDEAGLRYASLEDGVVNGVATKFHLPQQHYFFHDKAANKIYVSNFAYRLAMGASLNNAYASFGDASKVMGKNATDLLASAKEFVSFADFAVTKERNVSYDLTARWLDTAAVCGGSLVYGGSGNYQTYPSAGAFSVRAKIPFRNDSGCWTANFLETQSVCSQVLFNDISGSVAGDILKHPYSVNAPGRMDTEAHPAVAGSYLVQAHADSQAGIYDANPESICAEHGMMPTETPVSRTTWGNEFLYPYVDQVYGIQFYREKKPGAVNAAVRFCISVGAFNYGKGIYMDGASGSESSDPYMRLTSLGIMAKKLPGFPESRPILTNFVCNEMCTLSGRSSGQVVFGTSVLELNYALKTRIPFTLDYNSMFNTDKCVCSQ